MKRTLIVMVLMSVVAGPASAQRPRLNGPEAPRATDLLRAETLAEQAERRLKTLAPRPPLGLRHARPARRHRDTRWRRRADHRGADAALGSRLAPRRPPAGRLDDGPPAPPTRGRPSRRARRS